MRRTMTCRKELFLSFFVFVTLATARNGFPGRILEHSRDILTSYDFVVVGGGLSGLVVANRLSENRGSTVLVIEAGGFHENEDWITIPLISCGNIQELGWLGNPRGSKYDWNISGIPQPELGNRSIKTPAGKVVGGGTVLNGMVFDRGSRSDYDRWEKLGNPGWNFENLLSYFKKSEIFTPPDINLRAEGWDIEYNPAYHGYHGHVHSSFAPFVWPSTENYINSMKELGVPIVMDSMGGNATGGYWYTQSIDPKSETRSTSQGFYDPTRPNLHLLIKHTVTKIVMSSGRVKGVEFSASENVTSFVQVSKEVILSAGALHTPQLLQLSGIGPKSLLSGLGIKSVVDLPGVGSNYHDHILLFTGQTVDITPNNADLSNRTWVSEQLALYKSKKLGPFTTVAANFFAFLPLETFSNATALSSLAIAQSTPHYLQPNTPLEVRAGYEAQFTLLLDGLTSSKIANMEFIFGDTTILPAIHQPFSRGTVQINSTSVFDSPVINPRYLSNPLDVALFVAAFKYARTIRKTAAMQAINTVETYPGSSVITDEQIEEFVRGGVDTEYHHAGTASMLPRHLGGVVSPELRVYGVKGLRVIDASIIPMVPAAHLQATVYAIAEKGAQLIKNSY